jgi:hypothetical protein
MEGVATTPLPARLTELDPPFALCAIVREAVFAPMLVGENLTFIVQLPPIGTTAQSLVCENCGASGPTRVSAVTVKLAVPVLRTAILLAALVALIACVKVKLIGFSEMDGAATTELPVKVMIVVPPLAV